MRQFNQNIVTKRFINIIRSIKQSGSIKSYSEFANKLSYSPQSLNEILKGRRDVPIEVLRKLFTVCNINPDDIFIDKNDSGTESVRVEKAPKESPQALEEPRAVYGKPQEIKTAICAACDEKERIIQGLEARLADKDKQLEDLKSNFGQVVSGRDKQIEDLKVNMERLISEKSEVVKMKDEMLAMKEEAIKGKEATLATKDETIRIQSRRISELESHNEAEDLKKILGTSERIGQESISLTDIHPKDISTKAKKGEYKV